MNNLSDETTFGATTDSIFLSNPKTVDFQDGVIEFDILFDNDPGMGDAAVITFRMLESDTYYGIWLTNTKDWASSFILVRQGEVTRIGNESAVQSFPTRSWSRVAITVRGSSLTLLKDGSPLLSATDESWTDGKWGGIGVYAAYHDGVFHVDNFAVRNTSRPLTYVSAFTKILTTVVQNTVTSISVTTTTSTSTDRITSSVTTSTTVTSTLIQSILPVPNEAWVFIALIGFVMAALGGYYLHPNRVMTGIFAYGFGALTFFFAALSQKWVAFGEGATVLACALVPPIIGFAMGRYLKQGQRRPL
jgi:hypothetical protein